MSVLLLLVVALEVCLVNAIGQVDWVQNLVMYCGFQLGNTLSGYSPLQIPYQRSNCTALTGTPLQYTARILPGLHVCTRAEVQPG